MLQCLLLGSQSSKESSCQTTPPAARTNFFGFLYFTTFGSSPCLIVADPTDEEGAFKTDGAHLKKKIKIS